MSPRHGRALPEARPASVRKVEKAIDVFVRLYEPALRELAKR
jgi:hypothetical protein